MKNTATKNSKVAAIVEEKLVRVDGIAGYRANGGSRHLVGFHVEACWRNGQGGESSDQ